MNPKVNAFLKSQKKWQNELTILRTLLLDSELTEDFKWMHPCYTINGKNVILIHSFKEYFALLFNKGVLLKDAKNILIQQTENVQSARQIRFTNTSEIQALKTVIQDYIKEAIAIEKSGIKVTKKETSDYDVPEELIQQFKEKTAFKRAFNKLTPGRQRGYLLHFSKPKTAKSRISRIEKNTERILDGFGLNDCTCGLSKRKPTCDGSHKELE